MATLDWPETNAFRPAAVDWGASISRSGWRAFYTGQGQYLSHAADRLRCTVQLAPMVDPVLQASREAWLMEVRSAGHLVRLSRWGRPAPLGTLRGAPQLASPAAAGARTIQLQAQVGETLVSGDMLGAGGTLLMVGASGALAGAGGAMTVPLALQLPLPLAAGAPVTWLRPTGVFELEDLDLSVSYGTGMVQSMPRLSLRQFVPLGV